MQTGPRRRLAEADGKGDRRRPRGEAKRSNQSGDGRGRDMVIRCQKLDEIRA